MTYETIALVNRCHFTPSLDFDVLFDSLIDVLYDILLGSANEKTR